MKKQSNLAFILILATLTLALIYIIPDNEEPLSKVTGMHKEQSGRAIIKFGNETPPPPPPPSGGGGSSAGQAECCNYTRYEGLEYECECYIYDYEVIRIQPTICCKDPTNPKCLPFCSPIQRPALPPAKGVCPIEQTCGEKCCNKGDLCRNGQCLKEPPAPPIQMPLPPPELEEPRLVAIPYTEYAFPWWYFVLAIIILLSLTYLLLRMSNGKTPKPQPAPAPAPVKHRKKRRK